MRPNEPPANCPSHPDKRQIQRSFVVFRECNQATAKFRSFSPLDIPKAIRYSSLQQLHTVTFIQRGGGIGPMKPRQPGLNGKNPLDTSGCQLRQTILEDESDRDTRNPATLTYQQNTCQADPLDSPPRVFLILLQRTVRNDYAMGGRS